MSVALESPLAAALLLKSPDGFVSKAAVSLATGELLSLAVEPGITGEAFSFHDGLISTEGDTLKLQHTDGTLQLLPLHAVVSGDLHFERASADDVHLFTSTPGHNWLLHFGPGAPVLTELPEVKQ